MSLTAGIVGLPNVGKSTLFNAITNQKILAENYPFATIEPNVGVVTVPDERMNKLKEMYEPNKFIPTAYEFTDIAGLVKGASKGEGLGNKFLSHIREVDAIVEVVRCFDDGKIIHVEGNIDPIRDIETINLELIFSDIEMVERRKDKSTKLLKGDKSLQKEVDFLTRLIAHLEEGKPARSVDMDDDEKEILKTIALLSSKPVIYACNMSEDDFTSGIESNEGFNAVKKIAQSEGAGVLPICAELESQLVDMEAEEKSMFLSELGLESSGLDRLIKECYSLLGLISYLTAGKPEVRAWTIKKGTKAPGAAGVIHSDFEKGFIRAEVVSYEDLIKYGSMAAVREKGLLRSEGKEYVMNDGDVVHFLFNV